MRLPLFVLASSLGIITVVACSSGTSTGGTSGTTSGNAAVSAADCNPRCNAKATQCGATAAQATDSCNPICASTTTQQLSCLEAKSCADLMGMDLNTICPKGDVGSTSGGTSGTSGGTSGTSGGTSGTSGGTSGGTAMLGDACTCPGVSSTTTGFCSGTSAPCQSSLKCIYDSGSMGKGACYAESCCDMTSACDANKSLLKSCSTGTCKSTAVGYYCGK